MNESTIAPLLSHPPLYQDHPPLYQYTHLSFTPPQSDSAFQRTPHMSLSLYSSCSLLRTLPVSLPLSVLARFLPSLHFLLFSLRYQWAALPFPIGNTPSFLAFSGDNSHCLPVCPLHCLPLFLCFSVPLIRLFLLLFACLGRFQGSLSSSNLCPAFSLATCPLSLLLSLLLLLFHILSHTSLTRSCYQLTVAALERGATCLHVTTQ